MKVLQEEDPHEWTPTEIREQTEKSTLNSRWNKQKLTTSPPPLIPILLPVQSNQGDYIAKTQNDEMRPEIKPRYRQSRGTRTTQV
ncbi:hypothetical protein GcC1_206048 [Golovinomyces cichoracearum]|uniref:Uncharacterized protein n=1 Tax=Golovinomyces cichoracearum TaxID=62708 RepID=A0A420HCI3_9PEZI|nr:hypothetical protein GcC1_206048 [Golovinomyces cichoracearum]